MTSVQAAVATSPGAPLEIRDLTLPDPVGHEVLIRTVASGVCHTDLLLRDGYFGPQLPAVPGHEGSGVVEQVGDAVQSVRVGDSVVVAQASCGWCAECRDARPMNCENYEQYNISGRRANGLPSYAEPVSGNFVGQSSFATHMLVHENGVVVVPEEVPLTAAAAFGCGLATGAGAVRNVLKPETGSSIVVIGAGAVGMAAIMAARIAGCEVIIAVEPLAHRRELASTLGATHTLERADENLADAVQQIAGAGAGYAVDAVGLPVTLAAVTQSLRPGGHLVLVGANGAGQSVSLDIVTLLFNRTVQGVIQGAQVPQRDVAQLLALHRHGEFPFEQLIRTYPFAEVNQAISDSESGAVIKPILTF